jgi:hypothetical protein
MPIIKAARPVGSDRPSSAAGLSASSSSLPVHILLAKQKRVKSRLEKEASIDAQAVSSLIIETQEVNEEVIDLL